MSAPQRFGFPTTTANTAGFSFTMPQSTSSVFGMTQQPNTSAMPNISSPFALTSPMNTGGPAVTGVANPPFSMTAPTSLFGAASGAANTQAVTSSSSPFAFSLPTFSGTAAAGTATIFNAPTLMQPSAAPAPSTFAGFGSLALPTTATTASAPSMTIGPGSGFSFAPNTATTTAPAPSFSFGVASTNFAPGSFSLGAPAGGTTAGVPSLTAPSAQTTTANVTPFCGFPAAPTVQPTQFGGSAATSFPPATNVTQFGGFPAATSVQGSTVNVAAFPTTTSNISAFGGLPTTAFPSTTTTGSTPFTSLTGTQSAQTTAASVAPFYTPTFAPTTAASVAPFGGLQVGQTAQTASTTAPVSGYATTAFAPNTAANSALFAALSAPSTTATTGPSLVGFSAPAAASTASPLSVALSSAPVTTATVAPVRGLPTAAATTSTAPVGATPSVPTTTLPFAFNLTTVPGPAATLTTAAGPAATLPTTAGPGATGTGLSFGLPKPTIGSPGSALQTAITVPGSSAPKVNLIGPVITTASGVTMTTTASPGIGQQPSATVATTACATSAATSQSVVEAATSMTYHQLEEHINKWTKDLDEHERNFMQKVSQLNSWDRTLVENGDKIATLHDKVEACRAEQTRLDQELEFIDSQQRELQSVIEILERSVDDLPPGSQHADREREAIYQLCQTCDTELSQMLGDLQELVARVNRSTGSGGLWDPSGITGAGDDVMGQVTRILNAHNVSLNWIHRTTQDLMEKVKSLGIN